MNKDTMKGQWRQFTGEIKKQWGKLTDDELTQIDGNFDQLVGKIQERYGWAREQAERDVNNFLSRQSATANP